MNIIENYKSPNFSTRKLDSKIDTVIIHYTDLESFDEAKNMLCNEELQVSSHYLISEKGQVYRLVDEDKKAFHAGISHWQGQDGVNENSIGIELDNKGFKNGIFHKFSPWQIDSLMELLAKITSNHKIIPSKITGHADIAPDRKLDPGPLFPWQELSENSFGIYAIDDIQNFSWQYKLGDNNQLIAKFKNKLKQIGYKIKDESDQFDKDLCDVIRSFNFHFNPTHIESQIFTENHLRIADKLLAKM